MSTPIHPGLVLFSLQDIINKSPRFAEFLQNPVIKKQQKKGISCGTVIVKVNLVTINIVFLIYSLHSYFGWRVEE